MLWSSETKKAHHAGLNSPSMYKYDLYKEKPLTIQCWQMSLDEFRWTKTDISLGWVWQ